MTHTKKKKKTLKVTNTKEKLSKYTNILQKTAIELRLLNWFKRYINLSRDILCWEETEFIIQSHSHFLCSWKVCFVLFYKQMYLSHMWDLNKWREHSQSDSVLCKEYRRNLQDTLRLIGCAINTLSVYH